MIVTFDTETSIYNKGNPFDTRNFIVSAHIKRNETAQPTAHFYDEPDFKTSIRDCFSSASMLVGVNIKFDLHHVRHLGIRPTSGCRIWDCMLAEFVLSGQTNPFASLNELAAKYELGQKEDVVASYWEKGVSTENIPRDVVESYGNLDVDLSYRVYLRQLTDPRMSPELHKLIVLAGMDLLVLADMEWNGFKYNSVGSLAKAEELKGKLKSIDEEILSFSPIPFNLDSGDCLSYFLFGGEYTQDIRSPIVKTYKTGDRKGEEYIRNELQGTVTTRFPPIFVPLKGTELKKSTPEAPIYATSEDVLGQLKAKTKVQRKIVELLGTRSALSKLVNTYLEPLPNLIDEMHWADSTIHGQFNQVVARTGRLSSSRPNMQNAPEEVDEFFISRFD